MAKLSGAYSSLSRGVSQQPSESRLEGQHEAQINMLSDPVYGLSRRRGTVVEHSVLCNVTGSIPEGSATREFFRQTQVHNVVLGTSRLSVITTKHPRILDDPAYASASFVTQGFLQVFARDATSGDKDTGGYTNVIIPPASSTAVAAALSRGISSVTSVGRYLLLAPNGKTPGATNYNSWTESTNKSRAVVWIRGGAYNREYKLGVTMGGVTYQVSYTTPSASYPGTLNTSDIPFSDAEYTKKVNDRVNAYNSAVTAWIGTAGAAIQPSQIAYKLVLALDAATPGTLYCGANDGTVYITAPDLQNVTASDSGDDTLVRTVYQTVKSIDQLSAYHWPNKITRIQAKPGEPEYYMKAIPEGDAGVVGRVRWEETTAETTYQAFPFLIGTTFPEAGSDILYLAESPAALKAGVGGLGVHIAALPELGQRLAGDISTSPVPHWAGKEITHMTTFQDRLVICSNNVVSMSGVGDYFNFYRRSALTVLDDDPVEVYALGAETDVLRHSIVFDKSLLVFGDRQQYSIDGRVPVTPATTTIIQSGAVSGATDCAPVANGDLVFFAKRREQSSSLYQIEIGEVADTSNSSPVDLQLDDYLKGFARELLSIDRPNMVLARFSGSPKSIFVFHYLDRGRERLLDSWSRLDYPDDILGMVWEKDRLLIFMYEQAITVGGVEYTGKNGDWGWYTVVTQSMLSAPPDFPYLDYIRPEVECFPDDNDGPRHRSRHWHDQPFLVTAVKQPSRYYLHGHVPGPAGKAALTADFPDLDPNDLVVGLPYDSYVTLTSPYKRDSNDIAITDGRLTVNRLTVHYKTSGGFTAKTTTRYGIVPTVVPFNWASEVTPYGVKTSLKFNGRILGVTDNLIGVQPVSTGRLPVFVGRDSREYSMTLGANSWMPLTITSVQWEGQWFYNVRR